MQSVANTHYLDHLFCSFGRHSKSLDTERKVCGRCHGKFELLTRTKNREAQGSAASTPRTPAPFAQFVKENYASVKKNSRCEKHADVMKILSHKFKEMKT